MCIFVTVGVCVYACVCVEMHGGVLMSVFLCLPACMCTCSHLLVWMYVPLNVCIRVSLYLYAFMLCISVSCICIHVCVPMLTYTCPCVYVYVLACMHMYLYICACVLDEEDKQRASPLLISLLSQSRERTNVSLSWRNQCIPECSHSPTSSAQHSLPSMRDRASGVLPDGAVCEQF